jgi:hypothetical protein
MEFYSIGEKAPVTCLKEDVAVHFPDSYNTSPQQTSAEGSSIVNVKEHQTALHRPPGTTQECQKHDSRNYGVTEILKRLIELTSIQ